MDGSEEMPPILKWTWDHDACVNDPVSGNVWEDVLRQVAVWSYRCDLYATRLERVCKRWHHYWQVAEGVFDVDVRAGRLNHIKLVLNVDPYRLYTMLEVKKFRKRRQLDWMTRLYAMQPVNQPEAPPPEPTIEELVAENKRRADKHIAQLQREQDERVKAMRVMFTPVRGGTLEQFVASWPSGGSGDA